MKIGIDMGGMSIKYGLVNDQNEIIARHVIPTNIEIKPEEFVKEMGKAVHDLLAQSSYTLDQIDGIGIGSAGIIDRENGVIVYSNNFNWWDVAIVEEFKKMFDLPIGIANDADTAALGETCAGAAKGHDNVVLLTLGTGVGSGVVINKKIFQGPLNGGCELGHITIVVDGYPCTCGNKGCLESYASATGLMRLAREAGEKNPESLLVKTVNGDLDEINGKVVFDCVEAGDETAKGVADAYLHYLSVGVAAAINIFRPEIVILGGGVAAQKEKLTSQIQSRIEKLIFGAKESEISRVVTSQLGNDAGIIGAANLI